MLILFFYYYSVHWFKKMAANDAEISMIAKLEADFQQVLHVQFFVKFSQYCHEKSFVQNQQRNVKIFH